MLIIIFIGFEDYEPQEYYVMIPAGKRTFTLPIDIVDDDIVEETESYYLRIDSASLPPKVFAKTIVSTKVKIEDDDGM